MDLNQRVNRVSDHSKSCIQDIRTAWNHRDDPGLMLRCYSNKMSSFRALFTLWDLPGSQASLLLLHLRQSHEPQHSERIQNRFRTDSTRTELNRQTGGFPVDFYKGMTMTSGPCGTSLRGSGGTRGTLVPVAPNRPQMGYPRQVMRPDTSE